MGLILSVEELEVGQEIRIRSGFGTPRVESAEVEVIVIIRHNVKLAITHTGRILKDALADPIGCEPTGVTYTEEQYLVMLTPLAQQMLAVRTK